MVDWESKLRAWVKPPSETEDAKRDKTQTEIKTALAAHPALSSVNYKVYAKGSYANNTNVRLDYDVDIAVECTDFFFYDMTGAAADVKRAAATASVSPYEKPYTIFDFRSDVENALVAYYGKSAVTRGNMAMRVREKRTTLPADVVACAEYRYIYDVDYAGKAMYRQGTRIYPDRGAYIHNWPNQQYDRGVNKNNLTGRRFKRMVRALKRLENELVSQGQIEALPSFLMECLVYNVPNNLFNGSTYVGDMRGVLATIFNATLADDSCKEWLEVSERKYLFHSTQGWTRTQAHELASRAWDHLGYT